MVFFDEDQVNLIVLIWLVPINYYIQYWLNILNKNKMVNFEHLTLKLTICNMQEEFKQVKHKKRYEKKLNNSVGEKEEKFFGSSNLLQICRFISL